MCSVILQWAVVHCSCACVHVHGYLFVFYFNTQNASADLFAPTSFDPLGGMGSVPNVKPVTKNPSNQKGLNEYDEPKAAPVTAPKPEPKTSKDLFASDEEDDPLKANPAPVAKASKPEPAVASKPQPKPSKDPFASDEEDDPLKANPAPVVKASKPVPAVASKPQPKPSKDPFASDEEDDPLKANPAPVAKASKPEPAVASKPQPKPSKDPFASDEEDGPLKANPAPVVKASKPEPALVPKQDPKPSKDLFGSEDEEVSSGPLSTKEFQKKPEASSRSASGALPGQKVSDDLFSDDTEQSSSTTTAPKRKPAGAVAMFGGVDLFGEQKPAITNAAKSNSLKREKKSELPDNDDLFSKKLNSPDDDLFAPPVAKKPMKKDSDVFAQPTGKSLDSTAGDDLFTHAAPSKLAKNSLFGSPTADLFDDPLFGDSKKSAPTSKPKTDSGKLRD